MRIRETGQQTHHRAQCVVARARPPLTSLFGGGCLCLQPFAHRIRAQERLHDRFFKLQIRKERVVAATAVARELVGFVWAVMHDDPRLWRSPRR